MNLGWTKRYKGVTRVDEPVEDSDKTDESGDDCRCVSARNGTVSDYDVNRDVKGNVSQGRIKQPPKDDSEQGTSDRYVVAPGNELARNGIEN